MNVGLAAIGKAIVFRTVPEAVVPSSGPHPHDNEHLRGSGLWALEGDFLLPNREVRNRERDLESPAGEMIKEHHAKSERLAHQASHLVL